MLIGASFLSTAEHLRAFSTHKAHFLSVSRLVSVSFFILACLFYLQVDVSQPVQTCEEQVFYSTTHMDAVLFTDHCLFPFCFQLKMTGSGRTVSPMNVVRCCSKPSTTCWSAASWIAALFASGNGLWNPTRRTRSLLTRGTLTGASAGFAPTRSLVFVRAVVRHLENVCFTTLGCDVCFCFPGQFLLR